MRYFALAVMIFGTSALSGCKGDEVQYYRIAKSDEPVAKAPPLPPAAATPPMKGELPPGHPDISMGRLPPGMDGGGDAGPRGLAWTAPKGWVEQPGSGMRAATFVVGAVNPPGEVSVINLAGDAGGELANVNRWRGQLGLAPIGEPGLKAESETVKTKAGDILFVDLKGPQSRMLAAMLSHGGQTWFFKVTAPDASITALKPGFKKLLASVRPAS